MANTNGAGDVKAQAARLSAAIERLYAGWLVSTAVLVLACVAIGLYVHGALRQSREAVRTLEERIARMESAPAAERTAAPAQRAGERSLPATPPPVARPERSSPPAPAAEPPVSPPPPPPATQPEPAPARSESLDGAAIEAALDASLRERNGAIEVADAVAAGALLSRLRDARPSPPLDADVSLRLAIAARLLGRDAEADTFARGLAGDERRSDQYLEAAVRSLLSRSRPREALVLIDQWGARGAARPAVLVLRACGEMMLGQTAAVEATLDRIADAAALGTQDRVAAATLFMMLEQWPRFEPLVEGLTEVPAELEPMRDLLGAILLWRNGRLVESLAALDFLAEHLRPAGAAAPSSAGVVQRPRRYDIDVWRGATLASAGEWDAARTLLLRAAELEPTRPEAYTELGRIEVQTGRADRARSYLQNALTQAPGLPAPWEALAVLSINEGNATRAAEEASKAITAQPGRRSALLLRAIANAKLDDEANAAADIRQLLARDPGAIEEVRAADAIVRLFGSEGLDRLAADSASAPAGIPATP